MKSKPTCGGDSMGRPAIPAQSKAMSLDDVLTALTLGFCTMIALFLPQSLWQWAARTCASAHLVAKKPNLSETCETLNGQGLIVSETELARDIIAGSYLENIETMGEYLGYRGESNVLVEGTINVERAREAGRGVILWHSAFCAASLLEKRGYHCGKLPVTHMRSLSHPYSSTAFGMKFLNPIRTRIENKYLEDVVWLAPGGGRVALERLSKALNRNRIVSLTATGSGKNALRVPFFGGNLSLALGVPSLAYKTGAAVVPTATLILPGPEYLVHFGSPLVVDRGLSEADFGLKLAEAYSKILAEHVRRNPGSWRGWILSHTWQPRV